MKFLTIIIIAIAILSISANAATIQYKMMIEGQDADEVSWSEVTPEESFTVSIAVNVPDSDLGGGYYGGVIQYSFNLKETGNALEPGRTWIPFPAPGHWSSSWDSSSAAPLTNYAGVVNSGEYEVFGQTGLVAPPFDTSYGDFGAGVDVWTVVCIGSFVWDGSPTELELEPASLEGQLVYGPAGAEHPTVVLTKKVVFVPEPITCALLLGGYVLLLGRKNV